MAYWRRRVANIAASEPTTALSVDEAHRAIWPNQVWDAMASMSIEKVTAISAPRALAAIIAAIAQGDSPPTGQQTQAAIRGVGRLSHGRCLALADWKTLVDAAQTGIESRTNGDLADVR